MINFKIIIFLIILISFPLFSNSIYNKKSLLQLRHYVAKEQRNENSKLLNDLKKSMPGRVDWEYKAVSKVIDRLDKLNFSDIKILKVLGKYVILSYPDIARLDVHSVIEIQAIYNRVGKKWIRNKFHKIRPDEIKVSIIDSDRIPDFIGLESCCSSIRTEIIFSKKRSKEKHDFFVFFEQSFNLKLGKCGNFKMTGLEIHTDATKEISFDCRNNKLIKKEITALPQQK